MEYKAEIRQGGPEGATIRTVEAKSTIGLMVLAVSATKTLARRGRVTTLLYERRGRDWRQLDVHLRGAAPGRLTLVPRPCKVKEVSTA